MIKPNDKFFLSKHDNIDIFLLKGFDGLPFVDIIASFRLSTFKDFPYLYRGTIDGEREYLNIYFNCNESHILLVYDNEECVGYTSAIPLIHEEENIISTLVNNQIKIENYLYIGECILLPEYQNIGIAKTCLKILEDIAVTKNFTSTMVASVYRDGNHPLKPKEYTPINVILSKLGYDLLQDIFAKFTWVSSHNGELSENTMLYYSKNLAS